MEHYLNCRSNSRYLIPLMLTACLVLPLPALAAQLALATTPMATVTTSSVKPNVMFILDDSGSMDWSYLPDWANDSHPTTGTNYTSMPELNRNNGFNGVAYNPAITYTPPVHYNADGSLNVTTYPSQTGLTTAAGADGTSKPNWKNVKDDAYGVQRTSTSNLVGNASFYTFTAGEYCSATDLKTCVAATSSTTSYPYAAGVRWCTSAALTTCQSINDSTHTYPRYPGAILTPAQATLTINTTTGGCVRVSSLQVNGTEVLTGTTSSTNCTSTSQLASRIQAKVGNGFTATVNGSVVTITGSTNNATITSITFSQNSATWGSTVFAGGTAVPGSNTLTNIVSTTASYPYPGAAAKALTRNDCAGTTCTYAEEMTNYANWWTYYHTRLQAMKTSVSRAFKTLDNRFRVGFTTISDKTASNGTSFSNATFLGNDVFETAHKNRWFSKLFGAPKASATPLRGALSKAGQYYAKKVSGQTIDPVQYSCQQNFTILSTDGYWNTNDETSTYKNLNLTGGTIANMDGGATARPMYEGPAASSGSLADVAKYYYDTDLRTGTLSNCTGGASVDFPSGNLDVCTNNVFVGGNDNNVKQHMTTFTMGLGADGTLNYTTDYQTATSGDFYNLKNNLGAKNWPDPIANTAAQRIDDLWHAAVNGQGIYFSAKDPDSIIAGFSTALASITSKIGSGAAAAASTLNPVSGDNFAYVASYTTVKWTGNLEARSINVSNGVISESATWCAENVVAGTCVAPSSIVADTSGGSTIYNCVTPSSTLATCGAPGVLVGTDCKVELPVSCAGTMSSKVAGASDTRTIYTRSGSALQPFLIGNLNAANFDSTLLSQYALLTTAQKAQATPANLVNFLRGQSDHETRSTNASDNQVYRLRESVLGDVVESQPAFVGKPTFSYVDPGYSAFVTAQTARTKVVYMGANDGMLHCFNATTGVELWAYVPSMVIPNMWKLADANYASMHTNFVNGNPIVSDVYSGGAWHTILVGGLNGGGRGYYALDITNPASPTLLWELSSSNDSDIGYSFGIPVVTKKADGTWVVLVTSGYNNASPGTGRGYLYVLNAMSGAIISKIDTSVGNTTTPSGLARISAWVDMPESDNTATYTYGGDLQGNVWRFDINSAASAAIGTGSVMKFATLLNAVGATQPITTSPELGAVDGKHIVYIGTGKYLEASDLTDTSQQSLYALKDDGASATLISNPRSYTTAPKVIQQTIATTGATRTSTTLAVNFINDLGWFTDFPDSGERQNVAGMLVQGTLLVPTTVPNATICSPGGYGWLNFFNYSTGGAVLPSNATVSTKTNAPIVGLNVFHLPATVASPSGSTVVSVVTSDHPTPDIAPNVQINPGGGNSTTFVRKRVLWRELTPP